MIFDAADSWGKDLLREGVLTDFVEVDLSDEPRQFDNCLAALQIVEEVGHFCS